MGYLVFSLAFRATGRRPPGDVAAVVLLVATMLPDLVDKPLSWGLGLFNTGYALGHSALVAVPVGLLVLAVGARTDRQQIAAAFVVGHWSHLVADVLDPLRYGDAPLPERVLWPLVTGTPYEQDLGLGRGVSYLAEFVASLRGMDLVALVGLYLLLPLLTFAIWVLDGAPGLGLLTRSRDWD